MVFAGPPEDDIDWADVSPGRFAASSWQRAWRLAGDVTSAPGADSGHRGRRRCARSRTAPSTTRPSCWRSQRFNVVVARVMELVNATRKAIDSGAGAATRPSARPSRPWPSC